MLLQLAAGALEDNVGNGNTAGVPVFVHNNVAQTGHPSAVRSLRAHARNQEVHLFWDTPAIVTGGDDDSFVFQYEYRQKAGSGAWGAWTATPQSPPSSGVTLKGFDNGTEYSFQVRAKNRHKRVGPDGQTVTATPNPKYRASLSVWGIRRGGDPTEATLTVSNGPFREARTYTIEWNGQPTDQGLLHSGNATSVTLPAGDIHASVNLRAAADDDGPTKVYNREVEHPLVYKENGTEVVRTKPGDLWDGNLSVHDNEPEPVASLEAPAIVDEGEDFRLTVRFGHRLDQDADIRFGFSNPSRAKWNLTGVPDPRVITIPEGELTGTTGPIRKPGNTDKDSDTEITFVLKKNRDEPWLLGHSARTVRFNDDETPDSERGAWLRTGPASATESGDGSDTVMTFRVDLDDRRGTKTTITVDYRTVDGTAKAGIDYVAASGTLTFAPGEKSKEFDVTVKDDDVDDDGETFEVRLENPTGGGSIHPQKGTATGRIENTETAVLSATFPASRFMSSSHKGADDRPQVIVEFSETVAAFDASTPSVTVTEGAVASVKAHTEDGLEHAYIFWLTPAGNDEMTFALVANAACDAGGICTAQQARS